MGGTGAEVTGGAVADAWEPRAIFEFGEEFGEGAGDGGGVVVEGAELGRGEVRDFEELGIVGEFGGVEEA